MDEATTIPGRSPKMADALVTPGSRNARTAAAWVPTQPRTGRAGDQALVTTHRLPRVRVVDRDEFLLGAAAGRAVTHVGFADATMRDVARRDGRWLHARLAGVARDLVGVDIDVEGVAEARAAGYEAHAIDCGDPADVARAAIRPSELVVVSEVIEYVDSVGAFLDGLRALTTPDGTMVVTTSNAFRLMNLAATLTGRELAHPGHVSRYSWYTLVSVLERHSWQVVAFHPYEDSEREMPGRARTALAAERAARLFAPFLASGLIAVCRQAPTG